LKLAGEEGEKTRRIGRLEKKKRMAVRFGCSQIVSLTGGDDRNVLTSVPAKGIMRLSNLQNAIRLPRGKRKKTIRGKGGGEVDRFFVREDD